MKLLLILPSQQIDGGKVYKAKKLMSPRLSLPDLVSLIPPNINVKIIDEYFEEITFKDAAALPRITFMSPKFHLAFFKDDEFQRHGEKVE